MDFNLIAGYLSLGVVIIKELVVYVNHKRCKSRCCSRQAVVSMDIENTTPEIKIKAPVDDTGKS